MKLGVWLEDIQNALLDGAIQESSTVIALHRNPGVPLGADGCWDARPILAIERDDDDVDLITYGPETTPMSVADVQNWYGLNPDCGDCDLFVPEPWEEVDGEWGVRRDLPAIGPVMNSELSQFGVMVWYDESELELG